MTEAGGQTVEKVRELKLSDLLSNPDVEQDLRSVLFVEKNEMKSVTKGT